MGGTIAELTMTVGKSIAAFNRHDKSAVKENLAQDITVVSIRPKETASGHVERTTASGSEGVKNIVDQFNDDPTFTLLHLDIDLHGATDGAANNATLTGTAKWKDKHGAETLQFTFECIFNDRWLFRKVSAVTV